MIINDNGNIQQHLSPSTHQLSPSAFLTAARRAPQRPNLSPQISSVSHLLVPNVRCALKHHMAALPIHNHYLGAFDSGAEPGPRSKKGIKTLGNVKTRGEGAGGKTSNVVRSQIPPLALSYQSHWLAHVILLWFGLANQWAADWLPVTVPPLDWRWKIP